MNMRSTSGCEDHGCLHVQMTAIYSPHLGCDRQLGPVCLHRDHHTCILVPAQQRIVPVLRARFRNVRPACHKVLVQICSCEAAGDGSIHRFHDFEVGGEEDVEIALVNLLYLLASTRVGGGSGDSLEAS